MRVTTSLFEEKWYLRLSLHRLHLVEGQRLLTHRSRPVSTPMPMESFANVSNSVVGRSRRKAENKRSIVSFFQTFTSLFILFIDFWKDLLCGLSHLLSDRYSSERLLGSSGLKHHVVFWLFFHHRLALISLYNLFR